MKKTIITLIAVLALAIGTTATEATAGTTAKATSAARPAVSALSASLAVPTTCPPAGVVGRALGLTVSKPTVVMAAAGFALECQYKNGTGKQTLSWEKETQAAFLSGERAIGVKPITGLGKGVQAYSVSPHVLSVQRGTVACTIEAGVNLAHLETLAIELLRSYW